MNVSYNGKHYLLTIVGGLLRLEPHEAGEMPIVMRRHPLACDRCWTIHAAHEDCQHLRETPAAPAAQCC